MSMVIVVYLFGHMKKLLKFPRYLLKPIGAGAYFSDFYRKNRQSRWFYKHVASRPTRGHGEKFLCVVAHYRIGYRPHATISAHRVTFSREIGMRKRKYRWLSRRLPSDGPRRETKLDAGHNGADIVGQCSFLRTPCKEMTPQETRQLRRTTKSAHRTRVINIRWLASYALLSRERTLGTRNRSEVACVLVKLFKDFVIEC